MSVRTVRFFDKSNASSFASAASRPRFCKSMSVCSGWMPQRVMICGISETVDKMTSTLSPSELLSRLCGEAEVSRGSGRNVLARK